MQNQNNDDFILKNLHILPINELFSILYKNYVQKVFNKVMSIIKNRDVATDLVQDIFIKIYNNLYHFKQESSLSTWIYSITYNECISYLRKEKKHQLFSAINEEEEYPNYYERYEDAALIKEKKQLVCIELIEKLSESDKVILQMKYENNLSIKEIQSKLSLSESAVKMRLKRAKDKLQLYYKTLAIDDDLIPI